MAKKRALAHRPTSLAQPPLSLVSGLSEAESLMRGKQWIEARDRLESLDRRYLNQPDVLRMLVNINYELKDISAYQSACERLLPLAPDDPDVTLGLAGSYMMNARPVLALRTFRRFLERFPDHLRAGEIRKTLADLEPTTETLLSEAGLSGADGLRLAELHEEIQSALGQGDYQRVRKLAQQLLQDKPDFAPALNNVSQSYLLEGKLDQAITTSQRVLEFDPGNIHALANLVVYHCRLGQLYEAREWADRLAQSDQPAADRELKIAEALSFLGDDEGVLAAFDAAERQGELKLRGTAGAQLCHLAAVAELRMGREAMARRYWQRALKLNPGLELAHENLDDLRRPVGERHAPWPFAFGNWTTQRSIEDLSRQIGTKKGDQALTNAVRRFLQKHAEVAVLVPILLDRGDPRARQYALILARTARTPELLVALHDFALGQRGPDALRHQAAQAADEAALFPDRQVRMWLGGEWREIVLMGFEITGESEKLFGPQVQALVGKAIEALHANQGASAEGYLKQALELEPESSSLLNNLAMAYEQQGRSAEAEALTREIAARDPDYLFARVALARLHMREGDFTAAEELIKPLLARRRLHFTEASALFGAQADLYLAQGNNEAARSWLEMWAGINPDDPQLQRRQVLVQARSGLERLLKRRK